MDYLPVPDPAHFGGLVANGSGLLRSIFKTPMIAFA
jgi:hypothetical protein